jgi:hypothetical protein
MMREDRRGGTLKTFRCQQLSLKPQPAVSKAHISQWEASRCSRRRGEREEMDWQRRVHMWHKTH